MTKQLFCFLGASLLAATCLSAAVAPSAAMPSPSQCTCNENCTCTAEKHCGCFSSVTGQCSGNGCECGNCPTNKN